MQYLSVCDSPDLLSLDWENLELRGNGEKGEGREGQGDGVSKKMDRKGSWRDVKRPSVTVQV